MTDWAALFAFETPLLEIFVRGSCVYWALFLIMRFVLKRGTGSVGVSDILVIVLMGDAIQNAMAGEYKTITDGVLLVLTIVGWDYATNWAGYHSKTLRRFVQDRKICLVKDGAIQWDNMRTELINEEDLLTQLRLNDASNLKEIKEAYLEPNGEISVVKHDSGNSNPRKATKKAV